jgi:hypothetical protein
MHPHPTQPVIRVASAAALFSALQARNSFTSANPIKSTSPTLGDVLGAPQRELDASQSAALIPSAVLLLASVDPMSHEPLRLKLWINATIGFLGLALCACYLAQDWEQQRFLVAVTLGATRDLADVDSEPFTHAGGRTRALTYTTQHLAVGPGSIGRLRAGDGAFINLFTGEIGAKPAPQPRTLSTRCRNVTPSTNYVWCGVDSGVVALSASADAFGEAVEPELRLSLQSGSIVAAASAVGTRADALCVFHADGSASLEHCTTATDDPGCSTLIPAIPPPDTAAAWSTCELMSPVSSGTATKDAAMFVFFGILTAETNRTLFVYRSAAGVTASATRTLPPAREAILTAVPSAVDTVLLTTRFPNSTVVSTAYLFHSITNSLQALPLASNTTNTNTITTNTIFAAVASTTTGIVSVLTARTLLHTPSSARYALPLNEFESLAAAALLPSDESSAASFVGIVRHSLQQTLRIVRIDVTANLGAPSVYWLSGSLSVTTAVVDLMSVASLHIVVSSSRRVIISGFAGGEVAVIDPSALWRELGTVSRLAEGGASVVVRTSFTAKRRWSFDRSPRRLATIGRHESA